jgi:hypothetical protein
LGLILICCTGAERDREGGASSNACGSRNVRFPGRAVGQGAQKHRLRDLDDLVAQLSGVPVVRQLPSRSACFPLATASPQRDREPQARAWAYPVERLLRLSCFRRHHSSRCMDLWILVRLGEHFYMWLHLHVD